MKNYSANGIEEILNESKQFGKCYIGNMCIRSCLTGKGLKKIMRYLESNRLNNEYSIVTGYEFPGYIVGDMYIAYAK